MKLFSYSDRDVFFHYSVDEYPKKSNFPAHLHDSYEVYCLDSADVEFLVEGQLYRPVKGSVVVLRGAETHKVNVGEKEYRRFAIHFNPKLFAEMPYLLEPFTNRALGEMNLYQPSEFNGIKPLEIFREMCNDRNDRQNKIAITVLLSHLLLSISDAFCHKSQKESSFDRLETQMLSFVNDHLFEKITVVSLCEQFHLSRSQIGRIFKNVSGTSVGNYIVLKRLVNAQQLILKGNSAMSACKQSGFSDYSSFYRLYKKRFGYSPNETGK